MTQPSSREICPPVASISMASAVERLPNSQSSSTMILPAFLPETVSVSAATTSRPARVTRWVMVRTWS
ncbi:hypothetical protein D9M68_637560 [compost metagenome]